MNPIMIAITLGYIIGILWGLYFNISIALLFVVLIVVYIVFKMNIKQFLENSNKLLVKTIKECLKVNLILIFVVFSIISNTIVLCLNNRYENKYKDVTNAKFIGTITEIKEKEYRYSCKVKINTVNSDRSFKNTYIILNIKKSNWKLNIEYGNLIEFDGNFENPSGARNQNGFDNKKYYQTIKVYGNVELNGNIKILKKNNADLLSFLANKFNLKAKENIDKLLPKETSGLLIGILLGDKSNISKENIDNFKDSSLSHLLAVSGAHISYIITGFSICMNKYKKVGKIVTIACLFFFMFIVGWSPSVVRACIMGILLLMSGLCYRKSNTWNNMEISLLLILIDNPFNIGNVGLILSYGGTIGIIALNKNILKLLKVKEEENKFIAKVKELLSITISAQIVILPIMIVNFGTVALLFFITNLLVAPLLGIIVVGGFLTFFISCISIKIAAIPTIIINIFINILILIAKLPNIIPFFKVYVITPNIVLILIYYFIIFWINYKYTQTDLYIKFLKLKLVRYKKVFIIGIVSIVITNCIYGYIPKDFKLNFIDVGQGDSCLLVSPYGKRILIDGGGSREIEKFDVGKNTLIPFLLHQGIARIDYIIVSHFDADHAAGLLSVMEELKVKNIMIGKQFESCENYEEFIKIVKEKNIKVHVVEAGQRIKIEKDLYLDVLWPDSKNVISENNINNNSLVCKLAYKNFSMLFTGDIEEIAEKTILEKYKDTNTLQSTLLKVAHHGSKSSSTEKFLNEIKPKIALIGVGEKNTFGHPNSGVLERLERIWE